MVDRFEVQLNRLADGPGEDALGSQESRHAVVITMLANGELISKIRDRTGLSSSRINYVRARFIHWGLAGLTLPMRVDVGNRRAVALGDTRRWLTGDA